MIVKKKVMAVASKGGHWDQLLRLRPVWREAHVLYVTNDVSLGYQVSEATSFKTVNDASMDDKFRLLLLAVVMFYRVVAFRPDVVISTGAAPGFFAIFWAKLFGAKTIWIDSIANANELSLAGRKVKRFADVWLTQWPDLAADDGPSYKGAVL